MTTTPVVEAFFDPRTFSVQYVVICRASRRCAIIDPVLDYDEKSGSVGTVNADKILQFVHANGLQVEWILDTHPHADHLSASAYLKRLTGAPIAIGAKITEVQKIWRSIYNWPDLRTDGSQWDLLLDEGDRFSIGKLEAQALFSPGHTLASMTYVVGDAAFVHDTLFMPDSGTARADFPGGDARMLWQSIQGILALPPTTRVYVGHDYQPGGRTPAWETSVAMQREMNIHVADGATEADYVSMRMQRDKTLPIPRLMLHALQVNINGGKLPDVETNGRAYMKIPLGAFPSAIW